MTPYEQSDLSVSKAVGRLGRLFATFDARTQDSGHVSYGVVSTDDRRSFVKTAGDRTVSPGGQTHDERVAALRRAAAIQEVVDHPALVPLHRVVDAADGVVVIYDWFDGELLRSPPDKGTDPSSARARFLRLPLTEVTGALDAVIDLHVALERHGWIAGDFYDGCLMYDFGARRIKVIDLEAYRHGPYVNETGRLPGSTRFMAPEEHTRGSVVDARTTVYNLGRMLAILVADEHRSAQLLSLVDKATAVEQDRRFASVGQLHRAWRAWCATVG